MSGERQGAGLARLEKQLSRRKGRIEHREELVHHRGMERVARAAAPRPRRAPSKRDGGRSNGGRVRAEGLSGKPMSVEEAMLQLDRSAEAFLVFRNGDSEEINVLYRRKDGAYGLVDPSL